MGWFDDLLTDTARQAAPGISQAITDDQKKKRDLEAMRQSIPVLVEQQKALMPGELEKIRASGEITAARDAFNREAAFKQAVKIQEMKNAAKGNKDNPFLSMLTSRVEQPQNPAVMPVQAGQPGYGSGEEAASGTVPQTKSVPAWKTFLSAFGANPEEHEPQPSVTSTGGVGVTFPRKPSTATNVRSSGLSNEDIQAGLSITENPLPRDVNQWTETDWNRAKEASVEWRQKRAVGVDQQLIQLLKQKHPANPASAYDEYVKIKGERVAYESWMRAWGPTVAGAPQITSTAPAAATPPGSSAAQPGPSQVPPRPGAAPPSGLSPEEQQRFDRMSPTEKKAFLGARGTAGGSKPSEETKRQVAAGLNVARMLDDLTNSTDIETYGYSGKRAIEEGRDVMSGVTMGAIKSNPDYIKFRQILRQLELGAFDFGGKQLTQTEKDFVMAALPSTWQRNPDSMRAAIKEFSNRVKYMTGLWSKFASLSGAEYDNLVASEMSKYGKGASTPQQGAAPGATGGKYKTLSNEELLRKLQQ